MRDALSDKLLELPGTNPKVEVLDILIRKILEEDEGNKLLIFDASARFVAAMYHDLVKAYDDQLVVYFTGAKNCS